MNKFSGIKLAVAVMIVSVSGAVAVNAAESSSTAASAQPSAEVKQVKSLKQVNDHGEWATHHLSAEARERLQQIRAAHATTLDAARNQVQQARSLFHAAINRSADEGELATLARDLAEADAQLHLAQAKVQVEWLNGLNPEERALVQARGERFGKGPRFGHPHHRHPGADGRGFDRRDMKRHQHGATSSAATLI